MGFVFTLFAAFTAFAIVIVGLVVRFLSRQMPGTDRPEAKMRSTVESCGCGQSLKTDASNIAVGIDRKWILSEIPLLNNLKKTLGEVIEELPDMVFDLVAGKQISGKFRLDGMNTQKTGIHFNDPDLATDNTIQILAHFHDILISANEVHIKSRRHLGARPHAFAFNVKIPVLEITLKIALQENNKILVSLTDNGINLPSVQVTAKPRLAAVHTTVHGSVADSVTEHFAPSPVFSILVNAVELCDSIVYIVPDLVSSTLDDAIELCNDIAALMNPLFRAKLIKGLSTAIKDMAENIIPDGLDKMSFPIGDGRLINFISFNGMTLDDRVVWMKVSSQWSAHVKGKPDHVPHPEMHLDALAKPTITKRSSHITAFIDTSVVNQLLDVCFYVTPDASTYITELKFGDVLLSIIDHLPGWKPKKHDKLTCQVRASIDPPVLVASENALFASIHGNAMLTIDEKNKADGHGLTSLVTLLRAEVDARADVAGPTYDPANGTFNFHLLSFAILGFSFTDNKDLKMNHWLSHFLDHVLTHEEHSCGFEHWWQTEGRFIEKCEKSLNSFGEQIEKHIRDKIDHAIDIGVRLVNKVINEKISRFTLPTGGFMVLGHKIQLGASSIVISTHDGLFKIMVDLDVKDVITDVHS